ncbi:hypothetical protein PF010_g3581 [Phytophthora fragariae]|uniref:Uncharacterized protein n=1 Tax=Phytophthora fragariae TaxID=53985 RepID=A0A6G0LU32_9STRA|nr:hypothetical protein PF010_g3581 [Phytophthora fragariae]
MIARTANPRCRSQPTITSEHALHDVSTLRQINNDRLSSRSEVVLLAQNDSVDEANSPSPIYHSHRNAGSGSENVLSLTNFSPVKFERLWSIVRAHVTTNWNMGRGKCAYTAKDVLFMMPTVLKNCGKWDVVAAVFRVKPPSIQKMVTKFVVVVAPFLYDYMVASALDKFPMKKIVLSGQAFSNYAAARYATDATFQQSNMPSGRMKGRSLYYSKKHHLH